MRSLFRPAFVVYSAACIAIGVLISGLPLFETLGYEYALASAMTVSVFSGCMAAGLPHRLRDCPHLRPVGMGRIFFQAAAEGLFIAFVLLTVSLINGFYVPFCNLTEGLAFFLWMPVFSALIAAAMGLFAGLVFSSAKRAVLLFVLMYIIALCSGFYSFYSTPAVFVFHPFAGYYPGVLYDRVIQPDIRWVTYRIGTLIQIAAIALSLAAVYEPDTVSLSLKRFRPGSAHATAAITAVFIACLFQLFGSAMGHRTDRADLEAHLSHHVASAHLDLFFPEDADPAVMSASAQDAEFDLAQVSRYFGVKIQHRIAVFIFADAKDKARMMGAGDTNVTKPWRREVYVTLETPPHPVLRHELAHAVSADFAPGPFAAAGKWSGLIPNPGLIEGLATAAGGQSGDLTIHQWAHAMDALGLLPKVEKLVGFGFFDLAAASAYTASGSFCDWVRKRFGIQALIVAYRTGNFETATKRRLSDLESEWKAFLRKVPLIEADKAAARARFDRKPIIRTVCVHETARLCDAAWRLFDQGDTESAERLLKQAHVRSQSDLEIRQQLFLLANETGDWNKVRAMAEEMMRSPALKEAEKSALAEMLLDLDMSEHKEKPYAAEYSKLSAAAETENRRRQLDVKAYLARTGVTYPKIFDVTALRPGRRAVDPVVAALTIAEEAAARPEDPVRTYLLSRQFVNAGDNEEALAVLSRAESLGLSDAPLTVRLAARMMKGDALLTVLRYDEAEAVFQAIANDPSIREGLRALAEDNAARAAFYKKGEP